MANIELQDEDLWAATWGSGWEIDPVINSFVTGYRFLGNTDWDKVGEVEINYYGEDSIETTSVLTIKDIERALDIALKHPYYHVPCGGKIDTDFDDWDACVGSLIIQLAIFGKEVYA